MKNTSSNVQECLAIIEKVDSPWVWVASLLKIIRQAYYLGWYYYDYPKKSHSIIPLRNIQTTRLHQIFQKCRAKKFQKYFLVSFINIRQIQNTRERFFWKPLEVWNKPSSEATFNGWDEVFYAVAREASTDVGHQA